MLAWAYVETSQGEAWTVATLQLPKEFAYVEGYDPRRPVYRTTVTICDSDGVSDQIFARDMHDVTDALRLHWYGVLCVWAWSSIMGQTVTHQDHRPHALAGVHNGPV